MTAPIRSSSLTLWGDFQKLIVVTSAAGALPLSAPDSADGATVGGAQALSRLPTATALSPVAEALRKILRESIFDFGMAFIMVWLPSEVD
jgi:hypothetical protein